MWRMRILIRGVRERQGQQCGRVEGFEQQGTVQEHHVPEDRRERSRKESKKDTEQPLYTKQFFLGSGDHNHYLHIFFI